MKRANAEAEAEADQLNGTHPERDQWEWKALPRESEEWAIVRVARRRRVEPTTATSEAVPKPPQPNDPWTGPLDDLPGYR